MNQRHLKEAPLKNWGISPWKVNHNDFDTEGDEIILPLNRKHEQENFKMKRQLIEAFERTNERKNMTSQRLTMKKEETMPKISSYRPSFQSVELEKKKREKKVPEKESVFIKVFDFNTQKIPINNKDYHTILLEKVRKIKIEHRHNKIGKGTKILRF